MSLSTYRNTAAFLTTAFAITALAWNYCLPSETPKPEEVPTSTTTEDGWCLVEPTKEELKQEEESTLQKILSLSDQVFPVCLKQTFDYSSDELKKYRSVSETARKVSFSAFEVAAQGDCTDQVIQKYMLHGDFITKMLNDDPEALQIAAVFKQLSEPMSQFAVQVDAPSQENNVQVHVEEKGTIQFYHRSGRSILFTVLGDEVHLTNREGQAIGGYRSLRDVTIRQPTDTGVTCDVVTRYVRI